MTLTRHVNFLARSAFLLLAAVTLAACGGDGDNTIVSPPSGGTDPGTPGTGPTPSAAALTVSASVRQIPADGSVTSTITALAVDQDNNVVAGVPVSFSATSGALVVDSSATDANGAATATLSIGADSSNRVITVTATSADLTATTTIEVVGTTEPVNTITAIQLSTDQARLPTDGSVTATVTALVLGAGNNVVSGVPVSFEADSGVLSVLNGVTDDLGRARASVAIGTDPTPRTITLTASAGEITSELPLTVVEGIVETEVADLLVTVNPDSVLADSNETVLVSVVAVDENNNAVPNVPISFGVSDGVLTSIDAATDTGGRAQAVFVPEGVAAGTVDIVIGGAGLERTATIEILPFEPVAAITLRSSSSNIAADDSSSAVLTAQVLDANNRAVAGIPVTFAADTGSLVVTQAVTDSSGLATATLSAGVNSAERTIAVTASAGGRSAAATVDVLDAPLQVAEIVVGSSVSLLPSDGSQAATITVLALDADNNVVAGVPISFTASSGALAVNTAITDANGVASAVLSTGGDSSNRTITVTAGSAELSASTAVEVVGTSVPVTTVTAVQLSADRLSLPSDGSATATVTAVVVGAGNNVVPGVPVSFVVDSGVVAVGSGVSDAQGRVTATVTVGTDTTPRDITLTATAGNVSATAVIEVTEAAQPVTVADLLVLASPGTVLAGSGDSTLVTVIALDENNNTVPGVPVSFGATAGILTSIGAETDEGGRAQAVFLPEGLEAVTVEISVTAGGLSESVFVDVVLFDPVSSVNLTAAPGIIATDNSTSADVTAQVLDANNRAVEGIVVTFASDSGALVVTQAVTDASGFATATLSAGGSALERNITVSASAGGVIASTTVQAVSNPLQVASVVLSTNTGSLPSDGSAGATLTAIVRDANNNLLADVPVSFTADSGALQVINAVTNDAGEAVAQLGLGGDGTPRSITVSAAAGSLSDTAVVNVVDRAAEVAAIYLLSDVAQLAADGSGEALLTAVVVDFQNNALAGIPVSFSVSSGAVEVITGTTGSDGKAEARLTIAGDPTLRTITATAEAAGLTGVVDVEVVQTVFDGDATEIQVLSSVLQLPSAGTQEAEITAIVRDADRNVVAGVPVVFSADSGSLRVVTAETDESGVATALLSTGADPANRAINVTASVAGLSDDVVVEVTGTTLTFSGPRAVVVDDEPTYVVELRDSEGVGIPGQQLEITSGLGNNVTPLTLTTDALGRLGFVYTAAAAGPDTLAVSAMGGLVSGETDVTVLDAEFRIEIVGSDDPFRVAVNDPVTVRVTWPEGEGAQVTLATSRGQLDNGIDAPASVVLATIVSGEALVTLEAEDAGPVQVTASANASDLVTSINGSFFATTPDLLILQAWPVILTTEADSLLEAVVYDASRNRVSDQVVAFQLNDVSGGRLSAALARTDQNGIARVTYTAGAAESASQAVEVTAKLQSNPSSVFDDVQLTVAERQAFLVMGTDNLLNTAPQQYIKTFVVQVTDIEGRPAGGIPVQARVRSESYVTGTYALAGTTPDRWVQVVDNTCDDEDINRNGILDPGEDRNNSLELEAGNIATVVPSDGTLVTDADGFVRVDVVYPQEYAQWVEVELTVEATVSGTEHARSSTFFLPVLKPTLTNTAVAPPGTPSPFGEVGPCNAP